MEFARPPSRGTACWLMTPTERRVGLSYEAVDRLGHPNFLLLGHTHEAMKTRFRKTLAVNPGSVG